MVYKVRALFFVVFFFSSQSALPFLIIPENDCPHRDIALESIATQMDTMSKRQLLAEAHELVNSEDFIARENIVSLIALRESLKEKHKEYFKDRFGCFFEEISFYRPSKLGNDTVIIPNGQNCSVYLNDLSPNITKVYFHTPIETARDFEALHNIITSKDFPRHIKSVAIFIPYIKMFPSELASKEEMEQMEYNGLLESDLYDREMKFQIAASGKYFGSFKDHILPVQIHDGLKVKIFLHKKKSQVKRECAFHYKNHDKCPEPKKLKPFLT